MTIDKYLDSIQEDAWTMSGISIILNNFLQKVLFFILYSSEYSRQSNIDYELSKKNKRNNK